MVIQKVCTDDSNISITVFTSIIIITNKMYFSLRYIFFALILKKIDWLVFNTNLNSISTISWHVEKEEIVFLSQFYQCKELLIFRKLGCFGLFIALNVYFVGCKFCSIFHSSFINITVGLVDCCSSYKTTPVIRPEFRGTEIVKYYKIVPFQKVHLSCQVMTL